MRAPRGMTLVELLVVMVIILLVTAVALPTIMGLTADTRLKLGAQVVQSAFDTARDLARNGSNVVGVRFIPDPAFPIKWTVLDDGGTPDDPTDDTFGPIDPAAPLAYSNIVTLVQPPTYTTGRATHIFINPDELIPFRRLMLEEAYNHYYERMEPTNWFWNVRLGDQIKVNGHAFTVTGPMYQGPQVGNSECFVNVGPPGTLSPFTRSYLGKKIHVEFLLITNQVDDDEDGFIDEGFDGIDNDLDGLVDEDDEWEPESFQGINAEGFVAAKYELIRKPIAVVAQSSKLPAGVVIDATGWNNLPIRHDATPWTDRMGVVHATPGWDYTMIRSRLPVNAYTGEADFLINGVGQVSTISLYGGPPQIPLGRDFFHLWIADVKDVLPQPLPKGSATMVTINTRTGRAARGDADPTDVETSLLRQAKE